MSLPCPFKGAAGRRLWPLIQRPIEDMSGLTQVNRVYSRACGQPLEQFLAAVQRELDVRCEVSQWELSRIPQKGPVVLMSNHPFGGMEGLMLMPLLRSIRKDVKILGNYLLSRVPELREMYFFVDPFGSQKAAASNLAPLKEALRWLRKGGMLVVFPAGEVAHLDLRRRGITDGPWPAGMGRLVRKSGAAVLPAFFEGRNSILFQLLGLIHPLLRTATLPREFVGKRGCTLRLHMGSVIPCRKLKGFDTDEDMMTYLRLRTYNLANRRRVRRAGPSGPSPLFRPRPRLEPIIEPEDLHLLVGEIERLPPEALLLESDEYLVAHAKAWQIPHLLREIGRLREETFRQVGEGTGKSIDLDRFDQYYYHLFVWHRKKNELVGAYRLGLTGEIVPRFGARGLYTKTLFRYGGKLLRELGNAAELGRSFVREEYQRNHAVLMLLWKGIGQFVLRNPDCSCFFGAVSISNDYNTMSRQLLVSFLKQNDYDSDLGRLVKPKNPILKHHRRSANVKPICRVCNGIDEVSDIISDIEWDEKGVPVLLRHYLRLGGKLLGFNRDLSFGDVFDGLVVVDLSKTDPRILERYMGREGMERFLAHDARRGIESLR